MKRQSKAHFFNTSTDWRPIIPSCPMWAHEKQVIVTLSYCAICPYLSHYYMDGVECKYGDAEWEAFLATRRQARKPAGQKAGGPERT